MRRCAVQGCQNTDQTVLAHRFPAKLEYRKQWQKALNLQDESLDVLYRSFVVCTGHFHKSDYRNALSKNLNLTAVPHLTAASGDEQEQPVSSADPCIEYHIDDVSLQEPEIIQHQQPQSNEPVYVVVSNPALQINKTIQLTPVQFRRPKRKTEEMNENISKLRKYIDEVNGRKDLNEIQNSSELEVDETLQPQTAEGVQIETTTVDNVKETHEDMIVEKYVEEVNAKYINDSQFPREEEQIESFGKVDKYPKDVITMRDLKKIQFRRELVDETIQPEIVYVEEEQIETAIIDVKEMHEIFVQTEPDEDLQRLLEANPEFENDTRATLIQKVLEQRERIKEMEAKLEKYNVAMAAFKTLINID